MHQHALFLISAIDNLIGSTAVIPTLIQSRRLETQRKLGLGKYKDGPETEIDCSITKFDFEYYFERCYDETTQWSANGNCVNGIKTEISELHRCMRPDGSVPYCHDCINNDSGQIKHICGSDNPNYNDVCPVAQSVSTDSCIDDSYMAVYSYQCTTQTTSYYFRDVIDCYNEKASSSGPWTNIDVDEAQGYVCGQEWYYAYDLDEAGDFVSEGSDLHPVSIESNKYCLNCGKAIQICVADENATCEDLGLPESSLVGNEDKSEATSLANTSTSAAVVDPDLPVDNLVDTAISSAAISSEDKIDESESSEEEDNNREDDTNGYNSANSAGMSAILVGLTLFVLV